MSDEQPDTITSPTSLPIFQTRHSARGLGGSMHAGEAPVAVEERSQTAGTTTPPPPIVTTAEGLAPDRLSDVQEALARMGAVDWDTVARLRVDVSGEIERRFPNSPLEEALHREAVTVMVDRALDDHADQLLTIGKARLTTTDRAELHRAVMASLFGAGRLQPLLDLDGLENLEIEGHDQVMLQFVDGSLEAGPAVAENDDQLIDEIRYIARTAATGENTFSQVRPYVRQTLPDGSRFAAEAWVTHRPSIAVRKHRYIDTDLTQMRELGAIDHSLQRFLSAAIRAGKNIVVSGDPGSGKTTTARALLNELDVNERIATIETQYELLMHRMPHRHSRVWAAEARPGGEPGPDGRPVGEMGMSRLIELSLQKNVTRIVVGEVTGDEVMAMIEAMQGGRGSLSTIHASSAQDSIERLVTLITRARANTDPNFGYRLVAQNIDLIVHINLIDESPMPGGRKWRFVDDVVAVEVSRDTGVATTSIYAPDRHGRAVPTGQHPAWLNELRRYGFDPADLEAGASTWGNPPSLIIKDEWGPA